MSMLSSARTAVSRRVSAAVLRRQRWRRSGAVAIGVAFGTLVGLPEYTHAETPDVLPLGGGPGTGMCSGVHPIASPAESLRCAHRSHVAVTVCGDRRAEWRS